MKLSRYLYIIDEVIWSFVDSLLKQRSLHEALFWIFEYYYSGYQDKTWNLLWSVYYDFYAINYPKCERMLRKHSLLKENGIIYVVKNLFTLTPCPTVWLLRRLKPTVPYIIYKGDRPDWSAADPPLLIAIHKKHFNNVVYHMKKYKGRENELYVIIRSYFNRTYESLKDKTLDSIPYKDKMHILIALVLYLWRDEGLIQKRAMFIKIGADDLAFVKSIDNSSVVPIRKTLGQKRLYPISHHIGCFSLERHKGIWPSVHEVLWYHWEYFAYYSPIWKKRFKHYGIKLKYETFEVLFNNDDDYEAFHELYDYEPDEQSKQIQEQSTREIQMMDIETWIQDTF
jgi:hypothetical protein